MMVSKRLKGRYLNENEQQIGLVIYQPIPYIHTYILFTPIIVVVLACTDRLEYDFTDNQFCGF